MLADSSIPAASGKVAAPATTAHEGGEGSRSGGDEEKSVKVNDEGERTNYGGKRWPRQETLALLRIRANMDAVFRDASHKGPLWEEISRKLGALGYQRSAKKCKEKFENVYKYHKRTKDGRNSKSEGKAYPFFDQLEAFENHPPQPPRPPPPKSPSPMATTTATFSWTTANPIDVTPPPTNPSSSQPLNPSPQNLTSHLFSSSTSSSTASDEEFEASRRRRRKWKIFFKRLTRDVIKKQEDLQRKFLETIEIREHERLAREEAWRMQEMARINKEHEILIQERSSAAAKDAAVVAFLQKMSRQQNSVQTQDMPQPMSLPPPSPPPQIQPIPPPAPIAQAKNLDTAKGDNGQNGSAASISSRWPKAEVQALIRLRTTLDIEYQDNGPKGPLWEEISAGMCQLGYNRNAKRCKEKWENINKYFKKVKESNKKRPEDSKTCPYFHLLDALYKERNKNENSINSGYAAKPINEMKPLMVQPEQQWPLLQENHSQTVIEENERENMDHKIEDEEDDEDDGETEEEDDQGGGFEVVENRSASLGNGE